MGRGKEHVKCYFLWFNVKIKLNTVGYSVSLKKVNKGVEALILSEVFRFFSIYDV